MTAPRVQQADPMLRLQYYRETGQTGEAQQYEQYLRETGQLRDTHDSAAILRRNARGMANDREAAALKEPGYVSRLVTHVLNTAQGIPGVRAVEAAAGSLGSKFTDNPLTFAQSRGLLDEQTGNIGGKTSAVEKMMGSIATLPFLPANPAVAGGLLGGANEALSADDMSLAERGVRTGVGAGIGALVGRYADKAVTGIRSTLAKNPATEVLRMKAERALSAKTMYDLALKHGEGKEATQAIQKFVSEPDIAEIVTELQSTNAFKNVSATAPKMLDAIYKTLSDQGATAKKGLDALTPNKVNIGRFKLSNIKSTQERLLNAMEAPGSKTVTTEIPAMTTAQSPAPSVRDAIDAFQRRLGLSVTRKEGTTAQQMARQSLERHGAEASIPAIRGASVPSSITETVTTPAVMPTYRAAVEDFGKRSAELTGMQKGYEAVLTKLSNNLPSFKNLDRKTPEAFAEWVKTATPGERAAAIKGLLGATKAAFGQPGKTFGPGRRATTAATDLLRIVDPSSGRFANAGLLGINSLVNTP